MPCIEVATYRPAADEASLLAADGAVQAAVHRLPGLIRRTTARGAEGWVTITSWEAEADAAAGSRALDVHPAGEAWSKQVTGLSVVRYETLD